MSDTRTFLVTGGTGFLGSGLLHRLVHDGSKVILLKRSTSDTGRIKDILDKVKIYNADADTVSLERIFTENRIDVIVHCATNQGKKLINPLAILNANVHFPLELLQLASKHNISCFINTDTTLDRRVNAYALSKHQFREWLQACTGKMTCINVSLELVYGPGDTGSNFIGYVVRELLRNVDALDFTLGEQKRDFSYIDDVLDALMKIIDTSRGMGKGYFTYDAGSGQVKTIREFVLLAKALTGNSRTALRFGELPYREHEFMDSCIDLSGLRALGWKPQHTLEDGLRATIEAESMRFGQSPDGHPETIQRTA